MSNLWRTIESVPSHAAVSSEWRRLCGDAFAAFQAYLEKTMRRADSFPCPRECGCAHRVVVHGDKEIVAVCDCEPGDCDDIQLSAEDLAVWQLNETKLGRAVARAFGCDVKELDFGIRRTKQIASFGAASLPVVFTLQHDQKNFSSVVGQLVARMQGPFILLAPSRQFFDGNSQGLLRNVKAGFFDLETNVHLMPNGILHACKSGGELFSAFLPQSNESANDNEALRLFALVKALEMDTNYRKAPVTRVFQLYCMGGESRNAVAKKCKCSPALITARLQFLENKLGRHPSELRQLSSHLEKIADSLSDPRAKNIYRESAIDEPEDDDEE